MLHPLVCLISTTNWGYPWRTQNTWHRSCNTRLPYCAALEHATTSTRCNRSSTHLASDLPYRQRNISSNKSSAPHLYRWPKFFYAHLCHAHSVSQSLSPCVKHSRTGYLSYLWIETKYAQSCDPSPLELYSQHVSPLWSGFQTKQPLTNNPHFCQAVEVLFGTPAGNRSWRHVTVLLKPLLPTYAAVAQPLK